MDNVSPISIKRTWERRLNEAKSKHRPKLKNWSRDGFADVQRRYHDFKRISLMPSQITDLHGIRVKPMNIESFISVDRVCCQDLSLDQFIEYYEKPRLPVLIKDIPKYEGWQAYYDWKIENKQLFKRSLGTRYLKVGEDDDGYKVKVRIKYFLKYLQHNRDDSPLYIFDGTFDDDPIAKSLLTQFKVPSYFPDDLFSLVGEKRRPPYRWFLMGPERSGSCVHIDPLGTSAWNTLLQGRKRWVLFPPGTSKAVAKGLDVINKGEDDEAVNYFVDILPRIHKMYGNYIRIIEFTQEAGETVFVPGGWWHSVLNIEDTIAVTQNFCSRTNFSMVWRKTRTGRKKMSIKWLKLLEEHYPEIGAEAHELNRIDTFEMPTKSKSRKHSHKKDKDNSNHHHRHNSNNYHHHRDTLADKKRSSSTDRDSNSQDEQKKKKFRMS